MLSAKNSSNKFLSNSGYASAKNISNKAMSMEMLSTEGQQDRIKKLIQDVRKGGPQSPNAILMSQSELNRIRNSALIRTKEEMIQQKRILEEQTEKQHAAAKAKKQRMLEMENEKRKNMPASEAEMETTMKNETLNNRAKLLMHEDMDDVKHMNQMMLYSKVVTIRDKQLQEKQGVKDHHKLEEKRKDLMMEVERLKKIKYYEEAENVRKDQQRKAAFEIVDQIKVRELERLKEQEDREKEGQDMLKYIKQLQREEQETTFTKKHQQKDLLDTILESNQKAIKSKHQKIMQEKEEEERIVQYNIEKAQKDAEYQAELKAIKDEKEREVQKMRELQEKATDRQSEIDALRAKRASELADRQARDKERREMELRAKINEELLDARKLQSLEKAHRLQDQAFQEKSEFQRIIENQKEQRDYEVQVENEKAQRLKQHSDQLKKQIALNEERKKLERREFLEEGKKVRDKLSNERKLLETIKYEKLNELVNDGIEDKYTTELARKKITF